MTIPWALARSRMARTVGPSGTLSAVPYHRASLLGGEVGAGEQLL